MVGDDDNVRIDVGPHRMIQEADDLLAVYYGATPTEAEIRDLIKGQIRMIGERPFFVLVDYSNAETLPASARRVIAESAAKFNLKGVAAYGAGFQLRVVAKLVTGALALFRRNTIPNSFHDTRDAALAWIESVRNQKTGAD